MRYFFALAASRFSPAGAAVPRTERFRTYLNVWPVLVLFVLVLGGIYFGIFTPTEASGIGATGAACSSSLAQMPPKWSQTI